MGRIGPFGIWEILIILVVVLLIFGPRRLPEMAKGLGQSVRAFRKEMRDLKGDVETQASPDVTSKAEPVVAAAPPSTSEAGSPAGTVAEGDRAQG